MELLTMLSWLFLGAGLSVEVLSLGLLVRDVSGKRTASGIPGLALLLYLLFYGTRRLAGLPFHGGWLLGLVAFHGVVHLLLPLALRRWRPMP